MTVNCGTAFSLKMREKLIIQFLSGIQKTGYISQVAAFSFTYFFRKFVNRIKLK